MSKTPDHNPGALVATGPKALAVANRQLRIAGQALARIERERYIEFFATHPEASRAFVETISWYYPCSEPMIERYADLLNWERLSWNMALTWNTALIERYAEHWDWYWFSSNKALPWTDQLIERFAQRWHWYWLSSSDALPWSEALIERYAERWDWAYLSNNECLPWTESLIGRYADRWYWRWLSENRNLPWNDELIRHYSSRWDWGLLSSNQSLPWSEDLIARYAAQWDWKSLSNNQSLPWSEGLVVRYVQRWHWQELGSNHALPWSEAFIERHAEQWDWGALSWNEALPWSAAFIERYTEFWHWGALSRNEALPWTMALIECYAESWDWGVLSSNPALPWSEELIARYAAQWQWGWQDDQGIARHDAIPEEDCGLSGNPSLPWSEALIIRYADRWDWEYIPAAALSRVLPHWPEESVRAVLDQMLPEIPGGVPAAMISCLDLSTYEKAKPHFEKFALASLAAKDVKEFFRLLIRNFGYGIKPYAVRFVLELQARQYPHGKQTERPAETAPDGGAETVSEPATAPVLQSEGSQAPVRTEPTADTGFLQAGIAVAGYYIEAGTRDFDDYTQAMVADLGEQVRPHLRSWYEGVRRYPGFDPSGMTPLAEMDAVDLSTYEKAKAHFITMALHLHGTATDTELPDLISTIVASLKGMGLTREGVENMRPYILRFVHEVESGAIMLDGATRLGLEGEGNGEQAVYVTDQGGLQEGGSQVWAGKATQPSEAQSVRNQETTVPKHGPANTRLLILRGILASRSKYAERLRSGPLADERSWKEAILEQLETLKNLDRESWGAEVANKWNEPIVVVQGWDGSLEDLIAKLDAMA